MCMQSMNLIWPSMWSGGVLTDDTNDNNDDDDNDDDRQIMIAYIHSIVIIFICQFATDCLHAVQMLIFYHHFHQVFCM